MANVPPRLVVGTRGQKCVSLSQMRSFAAELLGRREMSEACLLDHPPITVVAFDALLDPQQDRRPWEFVAGRIIGTTDPTRRHGLIVSNIGFALRQAAGRHGCLAFFGGICVQRSDSGAGVDKPRPDLLVRCGMIEDRNDATDPLAIIEAPRYSRWASTAAKSCGFMSACRCLPTSSCFIRIKCAPSAANGSIRVGEPRRLRGRTTC